MLGNFDYIAPIWYFRDPNPGKSVFFGVRHFVYPEKKHFCKVRSKAPNIRGWGIIGLLGWGGTSGQRGWIGRGGTFDK